MNRLLMPAEYELPQEHESRCSRQCLAAFAAIAIILAATLALVTAGHVESPVGVEVAR